MIRRRTEQSTTSPRISSAKIWKGEVASSDQNAYRCYTIYEHVCIKLL